MQTATSFETGKRLYYEEKTCYGPTGLPSPSISTTRGAVEQIGES